MTAPPGPGWYPDYTQPGALRWFDGRAWTDQVVAAPLPRPTRRPITFGPLLAIAGVAALVFFIVTHPSVSVPLAGVQDCGSNSFSAAITTNDDVLASSPDKLDRALERECVRKGRTNVEKGVGALIVGLVSGGLVARYERQR